MRQWRLHITGVQRKSVDVDLLVQAVIALSEVLEQANAELAETASHSPTSHEDEGEQAV